MSAAEIVEETPEQIIDGVVDVIETVRNNPVVLAAVGVAGLVAGGVAGYFFAKKKLQSHYEEIASEEIAEAKTFYAGLNKVDVNGEMISPQEVFESLHGSGAATALREYQGHPDDEPEFSGEPHDEVIDDQQAAKIEARMADTWAQEKARKATVEATPSAAQEDIDQINDFIDQVNIFVDDTFDLDEEAKYRTPEVPYIITHEEYFENAPENDQSSLTYFELDDTVVDEKDQPLSDVDELIGEDHLVRFGSGSRDKNIVYVRNERLASDYEITRSPGSYLEEVLGMPDEPDSLQHSDQRDRRRALRRGDE